MNSIMMIVAAVIAILLVFIIFSQDDHEEESFGRKEEVSPPPPPNPLAPPISNAPDAHHTTPTGSDSPVATPAAVPAAPAFTPEPLASIEIGAETDLKFRLLLDDQIPVPTAAKTVQAVVVVVQIRIPEAILNDPQALIPILAKTETILEAEKAPFPFSVFSPNQTDRLLLFGFDEERDDEVFEAITTSFDLVSRFKKLLENDEKLAQIKARVGIGVAIGPVTRIIRGNLGPVSHAGKAVYLAETLAEAAGDFHIYVDEEVHRLALPMFDFREWKPIKLRSPMPAIPFYEVVGWNKREEVFAFASHQDPYPRRAVAVAYRYCDFEDLTPLMGLLSDPDEKVALEALATVSEIGADRALGILKKILPEAKNPILRSGIIESLGRAANDEMLPVLLAATKDVNWQVRFQAVKSLYRIARNESIRHIEHMVNDDDGAVRAAIHKILYEQYKLDKHLNALRDLLIDLSVRARKAAIEALVEIGSHSALFLVAQSYTVQEPDVKKLILRLLMKTRSNVLYQTFLNLFQNADECDRADIVWALRRSNLIS